MLEMIISVSGMGYTGSGAVKDFLKEYDCIQADDKLEFNLLYLPDGILDLECHLFDYRARFMSADAAIKRFIKLVKLLDSPRGEYRLSTDGKFWDISMDYIKSICTVTWYGRWDFDRLHEGQIERTIRYRILERLVKFLNFGRANDIHRIIDKKMYYACKPENFFYETQNYIKKLLMSIGYDLDKPLVLDQAVPFDNPIRYKRYLPNSKIIVVDKDPRDLYLLLKKTIRSSGSWFPHEDVKSFVSYFRAMRSNAELDNEDVLLVHFEDMIYEYKDTTDRIKNFLGLGEPDRPMTLFIPNKSINNTQLFNKYKDCKDDISYIEKELSDYLYDFSKYEVKTSFEESF